MRAVYIVEYRIMGDWVPVAGSQFHTDNTLAYREMEIRRAETRSNDACYRVGVYIREGD